MKAQELDPEGFKISDYHDGIKGGYNPVDNPNPKQSDVFTTPNVTEVPSIDDLLKQAENFTVTHNAHEYKYAKPGPDGTTKTRYAYKENVVLDEISEYIDTTYASHYTNKNNDVQSLDVWQARGTMTDSCIDTTIKYLMRYGKKGGKNRNDLLKAAHYIILALGNE